MQRGIIALPVLLLSTFIISRIWITNYSSGESMGLINGRLTECGVKPNCVCSEYKSNSKHHIEPILFDSLSTKKIIYSLKVIIKEMGGEIVGEEQTYLAATFSSMFFGFIDDLEVRIDMDLSKIHLRSASRLGYSDLGVNRKRIERIRVLFEEEKKN